MLRKGLREVQSLPLILYPILQDLLRTKPSLLRQRDDSGREPLHWAVSRYVLCIVNFVPYSVLKSTIYDIRLLPPFILFHFAQGFQNFSKTLFNQRTFFQHLVTFFKAPLRLFWLFLKRFVAKCWGVRGVCIKTLHLSFQIDSLTILCHIGGLFLTRGSTS